MLDMAQIIEDFRRRLAAMSDEELRTAADEVYEQSRMLDEMMKENKE
jgi:2-oxo-4-hydroxy-4-carboxy--5-ureidoimidazoline (OHCU) decarboxylase